MGTRINFQLIVIDLIRVFLSIFINLLIRKCLVMEECGFLTFSVAYVMLLTLLCLFVFFFDVLASIMQFDILE